MNNHHLDIGPCRLELIQGDITTLAVDAIVNAANSGLMGGGGVDGAIHRAGGPEILAECRAVIGRIGRLPAGQAVMTTAGQLPASHVIHTVGPVWRDGRHNEAETLASAYRESLKLAVENHLDRVAFPSISTGVYGYPVQLAARVALGTIREFLTQNGQPSRVSMVLFDRQTFEAYLSALNELETP